MYENGPDECIVFAPDPFRKKVFANCLKSRVLNKFTSPGGSGVELGENLVLNELAGSSPLRSAESGGGNYFASGVMVRGK
jgi:hypothetical protein